MAVVTISLHALQQNIDEHIRGDRSLLEATACHYCHYRNASVTSQTVASEGQRKKCKEEKM